MNTTEVKIPVGWEGCAFFLSDTGLYQTNWQRHVHVKWDAAQIDAVAKKIATNARTIVAALDVKTLKTDKLR